MALRFIAQDATKLGPKPPTLKVFDEIREELVKVDFNVRTPAKVLEQEPSKKPFREFRKFYFGLYHRGRKIQTIVRTIELEYEVQKDAVIEKDIESQLANLKTAIQASYVKESQDVPADSGIINARAEVATIASSDKATGGHTNSRKKFWPFSWYRKSAV